MALQTKTFSYGSLAYQSETNAYVLDLILTEESVDVLANTSLVSYKLQLRSGPNNRFNGYLSASVTMNGEEIASNGFISIAAAYNKTYVLLTGTVTLPHLNNGDLPVSVSGVIQMLGETQTNPYAPPDITVSGVMDMTVIPRASSVAATSVFIEDTSTILVNRKSQAYTHSIRYQFGTLSGYIADSVGTRTDTETKLTDTTILFPIPDTFYGQIPNAPSAPCTLTCTTYSGDLQIGDAQTVTFTITADPARSGPAVGGTAADINQATLVLTGNEQTIVHGVSNVECYVEAQARCSALIVALYINGVKIENVPHVLNSASTAGITFKAEDSRGYTAEYTVPGLNFVPYIPVVFSMSASRTDPTSGGVLITAQGKWYNGTFGAVDNALSAQYRVGGDSWKPVEISATGGDIVLNAQLSGLDYRYSHTIELQISDYLRSAIKAASVSKGIPVFEWGENDFVFHVPVTFTATDGTQFVLDLIDGQLVAREI